MKLTPRAHYFRFGFSALIALAALRADAADPLLPADGEFCAPRFALMIPPPHPILAKLERAFKNSEISKHRLEIREGRGVVSIQYLAKEDREAMGALREAVASGFVSELRIGAIIGPKVPAWVVRMMDSVPKQQGMVITGSFDLKRLMETRAKELRKWELNPEKAALKSEDWPDASMQAFDHELERLEVPRACRELYHSTDLKRCRTLSFRIDTSSENSIQWSR